MSTSRATITKWPVCLRVIGVDLVIDCDLHQQEQRIGRIDG
jgi:hypothetical protein